jgi:hypothetical protein
MKLIFQAALAAAIQGVFMPQAYAQWEGAVGVSGRHTTTTEVDNAGSVLVRESGWLPGISMRATYKTGDLSWNAEGLIYNGAIQYHGQTQAGSAVDSTTDTKLTLLRMGGAYDIGNNYSVLAAIEWEKWRRDIIGAQGSAGLQEKYDSKRLIVGAKKEWNLLGAAAISLDTALVISQPERLRVGFSGILDPASLETKWSQGLRIGASIRPIATPYLELRMGYDWIRIQRSDDVPVTRNGQLIGTIAQPEHKKQAVTLTASYIF